MRTTYGAPPSYIGDSHAGRRHVSWGGDARRRGAASPCAGTRAQSRRSWDSDACRPTLHDAVRLGGALLSPCQPALGCSRRGDATRAAARSAARAQRVRSRARHARSAGDAEHGAPFVAFLVQRFRRGQARRGGEARQARGARRRAQRRRLAAVSMRRLDGAERPEALARALTGRATPGSVGNRRLRASDGAQGLARR